MRIPIVLFASLASLALAQDNSVSIITGSSTLATSTFTRITASSTSTSVPVNQDVGVDWEEDDGMGDDEPDSPLIPAGVRPARGDLEADIPLQCVLPCSQKLGSFYYCYETQSTSTSARGKFCDGIFCNQETYDQVRQCLNCVIANGAGAGDDDRLNATGAAEWLKLVGDQCAAHGSAVQTTTLTATPTTTGPYSTSWASGGTVNLPIWTGVTQYTQDIFIATLTPTIGQSSGSGTASRTSSSGASQAASSAASAASSAAATSSRSAALKNANVPGVLAFVARLFI